MIKRIICRIFGHKYEIALGGAVQPYCSRCGYDQPNYEEEEASE